MKLAPARLGRQLWLAALLFSLPHSALADIFLNPGHMDGRIGLNGWTPTSSYLELSDNSNGFEASLNFQGGDFRLTAEGNQTYRSLRLIHYFESGWFRLQSTNSFYVPKLPAPPLEVDLGRPSGTLANEIQITGGTLTQARFKASATSADRTESYWAERTGTNLVQLPMVAGVPVTTQGSVIITVPGEGGAPPCTIERDLPAREVTLVDNELTTVVFDVNVSQDSCGMASVAGTVRLDGLLAEANFTSANVALQGPSNREVTLTRENSEFRFPNLAEGTYSLSSILHFSPPTGVSQPSGTLYLPNLPYRGFSLGWGENAVRNFIFDGVLVEGDVGMFGNTVGPYPIEPWQISFEGVSDNGLPDYGPSAGGIAYFSMRLENNRRYYQAVLTPGRWRRTWASFRYSNPTIDMYLHYIPGYDSSFIDVPAGGNLLDHDLPTIRNESATVMFDVWEPEGAPAVKFSHARYTATQLHTTDNIAVSINATSKRQNVATTTMAFMGSRGIYDIEAYAMVGGSLVRFSSTPLNVGTGMTTAAGTEVEVALSDGEGEALPISLEFETVTEPGSSSANLMGMGPRPAEGFELLPIVGESQFLDLHSSAAFTGDVTISLSYDPVSLGLSPEQEARLELHQYACADEEAEEGCEWVRISPPRLPLGSLDTSRRVITGRVSKLGIVALVLRTKVIQPPVVACVGAVEAPLLRMFEPGTCGLLADNANGLAGSCGAGEAPLASCTFNGSSSLLLGSGTHSIVVTATGEDGETASCTSYLALAAPGAPTLTLHGAGEMTLECNVDTYVDPGAQAVDQCNASLVVHRYNSGEDPYGPGPNTAAEGTYSMQYIAWTAAGETASAIRTVHVDDRTAPTLTLHGPRHMVHPCGSMWVDPGVEAFDACYGNLTAEVVSSGDYVNGWIAGVYTVRYELTDSGGNRAAPLTRTVEVVGCGW